MRSTLTRLPSPMALRPVPVVSVSQDVLIPAERDRARMRLNYIVEEGPFGEFVGYLSPADAAPVFEVTASPPRPADLSRDQRLRAGWCCASMCSKRAS
jgi:hypothetical protein